MVCPPLHLFLSSLHPPSHTPTNPLSSSGVKNYTVSLDTQTADITTESSLNYATVLEKIKKTGKTVNSGEADGVVQAI